MKRETTPYKQIKPGVVIEIYLNDGTYGYIQVVLKHPRITWLVRVLPGKFPEPLNKQELLELTSGPEVKHVFAGVNGKYGMDERRWVGIFPLTEEAAKFPIMRSRSIRIPGPDDWYLSESMDQDPSTKKLLGPHSTLTPEQKALPTPTVYGLGILIECMTEGKWPEWL